MVFPTDPDQVYRDFVINGVPASGANRPKKADIRRMHAERDAALNAGLSNGGLIYASKANLDADLARGANSSAWVIGDGIAANNGIYRKTGASGAGAWLRVGDLPYSVVYAQNDGSGTKNAIKATASVPIAVSPYAQLISLPFTATNDAAMTLAINGEVARPLVLNVGGQLPAGYVKAGMSALVQIDNAGNYRLFSYGDASSIQAAVEAATAVAQAAQAAAQVAQTNALASQNAAKASENAAKTSETNAATSATAALGSENRAKASETAAKTSETNAKTSETNAKASETAALSSKNAAATSATDANTAKTGSQDASALAQKWATNPRNSVVVTGQYSAYHWAQVALEAAGTVTMDLASMINGAGSATVAETSVFAFADGAAAHKATWAELMSAFGSRTMTLQNKALTGSGRIAFNSATVADPRDLTKHIALYGTTHGFAVSAQGLNYASSGAHAFYGTDTKLLNLAETGVVVGAPTGDAKGAGTLNAVALYQQGKQVLSEAGGTITGGFNVTPPASVTGAGTVTISALTANFQLIANNAAFSIAAAAAGSYTVLIEVTNGATPGAITFLGFNKVDGDPPTAANEKAVLSIARVGTFVYGAWIKP